MARRAAPFAWAAPLAAVLGLCACAAKPPADMAATAHTVQTAHTEAAPAVDAATAQRLAVLLPTDALLVGEQHDAPEHQQLHLSVVRWLTAQGRLAALTLEMAEQGRHTRELPPDADEARVRAALAWRDAAWPWAHYGPAVMAAVRAGVPVLGANLPQAQQRQAMQNTALDARLPPEALARQQQRIRQGHCNALPESQIAPMTRIQIARDMAMAQTLREAVRETLQAPPQTPQQDSPQQDSPQQDSPHAARPRGRVAVLLAGNGHVHRGLGVPVFLPPAMQVRVLSAQAGAAQGQGDDGPHTLREGDGLQAGDLRWPTPPVPPQDYCARWRQPGR